MSQFTNHSTFSNNYNYKQNKFYKQELPEFHMFQEDKYRNNIRDKNENYNTATKGIYTGVGGLTEDCTTDPVSEMFFSDANISALQKLIRTEVKIRTRGEYTLDCDQNESDLIIAMRAVLYDVNGGRFLPHKINQQVNILNKKVLNYIVPDMISNMKQEYGYIKEINKPLEPMVRPLNVSSSRNLPSVTTIWNR